MFSFEAAGSKLNTDFTTPSDEHDEGMLSILTFGKWGWCVEHSAVASICVSALVERFNIPSLPTSTSTTSLPRVSKKISGVTTDDTHVGLIVDILEGTAICVGLLG